jgi:hypothetical protein
MRLIDIVNNMETREIACSNDGIKAGGPGSGNSTNHPKRDGGETVEERYHPQTGLNPNWRVHPKRDGGETVEERYHPQTGLNPNWRVHPKRDGYNKPVKDEDAGGPGSGRHKGGGSEMTEAQKHFHSGIMGPGTDYKHMGADEDGNQHYYSSKFNQHVTVSPNAKPSFKSGAGPQMMRSKAENVGDEEADFDPNTTNEGSTVEKWHNQ